MTMTLNVRPGNWQLTKVELFVDAVRCFEVPCCPCPHMRHHRHAQASQGATRGKDAQY